MISFLDHFISDRPSSRIKLIAAWNALKDETKIKVLLALIEKDRYLPNKILYKWLSHPNRYIRYLLVRLIGFLDEDKKSDRKILRKIHSNKSSLVKSALLETKASYLFWNRTTADDFFKYSNKERLALIRSDESLMPGVKFKEIIEEFLKRKKLSTIHLLENYVSEYVNNSNFKHSFELIDEKNHHDGYYNYSRRNNFQALWELIVILSEKEETIYVAMDLIEKIPTRIEDSSGFGEDISLEFLKKIKDQYLIEALLEKTEETKVLKKYKECFNY